MEQSQEKFYQEEVEAQVEQPQSMDEVNDMVFFIELMKHLRTVISHGSKVPFSNRIVVDGETLNKILDDMDANLPFAIQCGIQLYGQQAVIRENAEKEVQAYVSTAQLKADRALDKAKADSTMMIRNAEDEADSILRDADKEAHDIVAEAEERADFLISENQIVIRAEKEAAAILNEARLEASEMLLKAKHDAFRIIDDADVTLQDLLDNVQEIRARLSDEEEEI